MSDFNINKALRAISSRVTDEQRDEQQKMNHAGRLVLAANSMEQRISLAQAQEISVRESIALLEPEPESELKTQRLNILLDRLGELYAEQGLYEKAIIVTPTAGRREQYRRTLEAIQTPDGESCECPPEIIVDRKRNAHIRQSMMQKLGSVVSPDHGRLVTLKVCRSCGFSEAS